MAKPEEVINFTILGVFPSLQCKKSPGGFTHYWSRDGKKPIGPDHKGWTGESARLRSRAGAQGNPARKQEPFSI